MFELFDPESDYQITMGTNLPHWFQPNATYFVTFRTDDSLPPEVSRYLHAQRNDWLYRHGITKADPDWQLKFQQLPVDQRREFHATFPKAYLESLDKGHGECVLRRPELSKVVADSLHHFDGERYHLGDFVIMPNHVHVLCCLLGETEIQSLCRSWKKFTATKINKDLGRSGRFWQEESFDHLVRSPEQFDAIRCYIAANPKGLRPDEYLHYRVSMATAERQT